MNRSWTLVCGLVFTLTLLSVAENSNARYLDPEVILLVEWGEEDHQIQRQSYYSRLKLYALGDGKLVIADHKYKLFENGGFIRVISKESPEMALLKAAKQSSPYVTGEYFDRKKITGLLYHKLIAFDGEQIWVEGGQGEFFRNEDREIFAIATNNSAWHFSPEGKMWGHLDWWPEDDIDIYYRNGDGQRKSFRQIIYDRGPYLLTANGDLLQWVATEKHLKVFRWRKQIPVGLHGRPDHPKHVQVSPMVDNTGLAIICYGPYEDIESLEGFEVWRATGGAGKFELIGKGTLNPFGVAYVDKEVISGQDYVYRVRSYSGHKLSLFSNQYRVMMP